ncbi:VOC family protein [Streptomyces beijiangensis]|uniref:VOC family protein n=1 Tax=Streptomyces beijiangensis TaxID=163361 RepID=A0A939JEP8_9ACTN|nr:VOC family protein [Streptomyces beijiangensis]MBO0511578.1 VOC family protein [Streptomyces beijiangensis]
MAAFADGLPCWADAQLDDLAAGKRFYGELFGWTFDDNADERYGFYTNAFSDGKRVAALAPKQDGRMPTVWTVYFATADAAATAETIKGEGGQLVLDPMEVSPYGTMAVAMDPGGAVFGLWQAAQHEGFEKQREPGSFCWVEVYTRLPQVVDPFYDTVFGYESLDLGEDMGGFRIWSPAGAEPSPETAVGGRSVIGPELPDELPSYFLLYFQVADCDATVATATRLGGRVRQPPFDMPYGRMAILSDDQGATFAVLQG